MCIVACKVKALLGSVSLNRFPEAELLLLLDCAVWEIEGCVSNALVPVKL